MKHHMKALLALTLVIASLSCVFFMTSCSPKQNVQAGMRQIETSTAVDEYTFDGFSYIQLDIDIADVVIQSGEDYSVTVDRKNYPDVTVGVANDKLSVKGPRGSWNGVDSSCVITITIPTSEQVSRIDLRSDVGDIAINGIAASSLIASTSTGDITADACSIEYYNFSSDVGGLTVSGIGDVEHATIGAATDVGDIFVGQESMGRRVDQTGEGVKISARTEVGDIKIS